MFNTRVPTSLVAYAQIGWRTERHTNSNIYESISGELYNHHFIRRKQSNASHAGLWIRRRRIVHYPILKPPPFVFNEQIGGFCKYWIRFGPIFFDINVYIDFLFTENFVFHLFVAVPPYVSCRIIQHIPYFSITLLSIVMFSYVLQFSRFLLLKYSLMPQTIILGYH